MASFEFEDLLEEYQSFAHPIAEVTIDGEDFGENKKGLSLAQIRVELTCGFEASIATFMVYNVFDDQSGQFQYDAAKQYIQLGSTVVIYLGYASSVREVFRGFIAKINFQYERDEMPGIMVTAMDMKGIMMANSYSRQLKAASYSAALNEILDSSPYSEMIDPQGKPPKGGAAGVSAGGISAGAAGGQEKPDSTTYPVTKLSVSKTPDAKDEAQGEEGGQGGTAGSSDGRRKQSEETYTVEMVGESDYEFAVKAAKKFNFEFFILGGELIFRPAKSDTSTLIELSPATMVQSIDLEYDITGLVGSVEVRNVNPGKGQVIQSKAKNKNKIGNKAKQLISGMGKVYIDPTADSKQDAGYRAAFLLEDMVYRFGTIHLEIVGLPELAPGKFIELSGMGKNVDNTYYIMSVVHVLDRDGAFNTQLIGKAAQV